MSFVGTSSNLRAKEVNCCRCNRSATCKNCVCVRAGHSCRKCLTGSLGKCLNQPLHDSGQPRPTRSPLPARFCPHYLPHNPFLSHSSTCLIRHNRTPTVGTSAQPSSPWPTPALSGVNQIHQHSVRPSRRHTMKSFIGEGTASKFPVVMPGSLSLQRWLDSMMLSPLDPLWNPSP